MSFLKSAWNIVKSPAAALFKGATGRDVFAKKEDGALLYVQTRLAIAPGAFKGSKADLLRIITQETDSCTAFVKDRGVLVGAGARDTCSNAVNAAYAAPLNDLSAESYVQDRQVTNEFLNGGNNTMLYVAAAVIILLLIVFIK